MPYWTHQRLALADVQMKRISSTCKLSNLEKRTVQDGFSTPSNKFEICETSTNITGCHVPYHEDIKSGLKCTFRVQWQLLSTIYNQKPRDKRNKQNPTQPNKQRKQAEDKQIRHEERENSSFCEFKYQGILPLHKIGDGWVVNKTWGCVCP